jgi:hypothetical protein
MNLKYLVIHTTDSPYNREVTPDDIFKWHLGPKKEAENKYLYMGKYYTSAQINKMSMTLPSGANIALNKISGRGWKQVGYSDLIQRSGNLINLVPYTFDNIVDSFEITNGASGYNSCSRHVVLAGGWDTTGTIKNGMDSKTHDYFDASVLYTPQQIETLIKYINIQIHIVPSLIVVGHNQLSKKTCPNFDVRKFLQEHNILTS